MTSAKFAIVLFYVRIFGVNRRMRIALYVISLFLMLWLLIDVSFILVECKPIAKFWDYSRTGHCKTNATSGYVTNGVSLALDLVIFFAPIPLLWKLKRSLADRVSVMVIFSVAGL